MKVKILTRLTLIVSMFLSSNVFSGPCSIQGALDVWDDAVANSTFVNIGVRVNGDINFCDELDSSWMAWEDAFVISQIYEGADPYVDSNRIHIIDESWRNNPNTDPNVFALLYNVVLQPNTGINGPLYCVRGIHGVYNEYFDLARYGLETQFCGAFGNYGTTSGGGTNDPCLNGVRAMVPVSCDEMDDPLLIDMGRDGIHLGSIGDSVMFDVNGNGRKVSMQWVEENGNEAFLARDLNGNGLIDNGTELFGTGTVLRIGLTASNGFEALAQYDHFALGGNNDGVISSEDEVFSSLLLWLDINADGLSNPDELMPLSHSGINILNIDAKHNGRMDKAGNRLPLWSWANDTDSNGKYKMVDVFFRLMESGQQAY